MSKSKVLSERTMSVGKKKHCATHANQGNLTVVILNILKYLVNFVDNMFCMNSLKPARSNVYNLLRNGMGYGL